MAAKSSIVLQTLVGLSICVPGDLECMTTYVLLEQEAWFEKEAEFANRCLSPGMTAIDVGANYGVYCLPMARAVGQTGRVVAYEPAAETAELLDESRALNDLGALAIVRRALSNIQGQGVLVPGGVGSETNALSAGPAHGGLGETVRVSTLDDERRRLELDDVDFIKIDAEGEDSRIIEGAQKTLSQASPLVMFEISLREQIDLRPIQALTGLGYDIYRLVGDGSMIVPWNGEPLDVWELNLFAAKPDRARALQTRGLLATSPKPPMNLPGAWSVSVQDATWLADLSIDMAAADQTLLAGLAAYDVWRNPVCPTNERYGALILAQEKLAAAVEARPNPERLSTRARVAWAAGSRGLAMRCLGEILNARALPMSEVFLPASPRFDALPPQGRLQEWFLGAALEQAEMLRAHSSYFSPSDINALAWACRSPFVSPQIPRRLALQAARDRHPIPTALYGLLMGSGHLNAHIMNPDRLMTLAVL